MGGLARVAHRAIAAGVATAGEGEVRAGRLADDGGARVEHAGHDGGIDGGHVAFEGARAVHHRHPGERDHVLDADLLARERARVSALDLGPPVPGVVGVLVRVRPVAGRARIGDGRPLRRHVVDMAQARDGAAHGFPLVGEIVERHVEPEVVSDLRELIDGGKFRTAGHGGLVRLVGAACDPSGFLVTVTRHARGARYGQCKFYSGSAGIKWDQVG